MEEELTPISGDDRCTEKRLRTLLRDRVLAVAGEAPMQGEILSFMIPDSFSADVSFIIGMVGLAHPRSSMLGSGLLSFKSVSRKVLSLESFCKATHVSSGVSPLSTGSCLILCKRSAFKWTTTCPSVLSSVKSSSAP